MAGYEHNRNKIFSPLQHILRHNLADFGYNNPNLPDTIMNAEEAMDWLFGVVYPQTKAAVATPADLPTGLNTPNVGDVAPTVGDRRFVDDDGDGKSAMYQFAKTDGELVADWDKIADLDWGLNAVVQSLADQTQPYYLFKRGMTDYDLTTELPYAGDLAGQHLYGGDTAGQNLVLFANNGDNPATNTGSIFFGDQAKPLGNLVQDFGDTTHRWKDGYFGSLIIGISSMTITSNAGTGSIIDTSGEMSFGANNLTTTGDTSATNVTGTSSLVGGDITISSGSITSTSPAISFGGENLSTTGTLASGVHTVSGTLTLGSGSIVDSGGTINFGGNNLSTTGTLSSGQLDADNIRLSGNTISITLANTNLALVANGTGVVDVQSAMTTLGQTVTGTVGITGQLDVDQLTLNGDTISSSGLIQFADAFRPSTDNDLDIGDATHRVQDLFLGTSINDGTTAMTMTTLMSFSEALTGIVDKAALFYNSGTGKWEASLPDNEIDHGTISGLLDDDHTQYALLAGRGAVSQVLHGGLTAGFLELRSNAAVDLGVRVDIDGIKPNPASTTYNIGATGNRFQDLYMNGQGYGFEAENTADAQGASAAGTLGRLWFQTSDSHLYMDRGAKAVRVGHLYYNKIHTVAEINANVTVAPFSTAGESVSDATKCMWQLVDIATNEIMNVPIQTSATQVIIANTIALDGANYRLMGIEL